MRPVSMKQGTKKSMPTYVIESEMPGVGTLTAAELRDAAQHSASILKEMGPRLRWVQTFVTADKVYAVYTAPDEQTVLAYACQVGLAANRVAEVKAVIDPTTEAG